MDVLTTVLSEMKLSGSVFLEADFTSPWCVISQMTPDDVAAFFPMPAHVISYHYVVSGSLLVAVGSQPPREVHEGEIILLPRNELHLLGSDLDCEPVSAKDTVLPVAEDGLVRIKWGGGGAQTKILCGFLGTLTPINSFLLSLPSLLVINMAEGTSAEWMASSFRFASTTAASKSPELLGRLAELLFAEAVRKYMASLPEDQGSWLSGLRDPHVSKSLTLLHSRPAEPWTTEALAREVGLSRSALADRFSHFLGEPPMRYLARHRMNLAANMLQEGRQNACNIAYAVGFNSEAAFGRAFKKEYGLAPGAWRKEMSGAGTAPAASNMQPPPAMAPLQTAVARTPAE